MARNILIFADGTGNEGGLIPDESRTRREKFFGKETWKSCAAISFACRAAIGGRIARLLKFLARH
jgi:hypothetical protein